jgi:hypothetical protein
MPALRERMPVGHRHADRSVIPRAHRIAPSTRPKGEHHDHRFIPMTSSCHARHLAEGYVTRAALRHPGVIAEVCRVT